jgi:hypothetical protein
MPLHGPVANEFNCVTEFCNAETPENSASAVSLPKRWFAQVAALAKALGSLRFGDPNSQTSTSDWLTNGTLLLTLDYS